jgi:hypothetical protein
VERLVLKHPNTYVPGTVQIIIVILNGNCQLLLSPILPFLVLVLDRLWRMAEKSIASLYHQISQYFFPPPKGIRGTNQWKRAALGRLPTSGTDIVEVCGRSRCG